MQMMLLPCPLSIAIDGVRSSQPPSSGQTAAAVQAGFLFRFTLLLQLFVLRVAPLLDATNLIVGSLILFHANHVSVNGSLVLLNTKPLSNSVPTLLPTNFSRQLLLLLCPIDAFDWACLVASILHLMLHPLLQFLHFCRNVQIGPKLLLLLML